MYADLSQAFEGAGGTGTITVSQFGRIHAVNPSFLIAIMSYYSQHIILN